MRYGDGGANGKKKDKTAAEEEDYFSSTMAYSTYVVS
jgi:hypothetical protein